MLGLSHLGFSMANYEQHLAPQMSDRGVVSVLAGFQHVSEDVAAIGYDQVLTPPDLSDRNKSSDLIADEAVNFLRGGPRPARFFLDVGFIDTHRPYPKASTEDDPRWLAPPGAIPDLPEAREDMSGHLGSLRRFDRAVGRVLDALDDVGIADNTVVIVTTDHGLAWPGMKLTLNDSGIGVMLMVRGAEPWRGGRVIEAMVSQVDLYPTIFGLLGFEVPGHVQGVSLVPLVAGDEASARSEVFAETNFHLSYEPQRCVRTDRWKYVRRYLKRESSIVAHTDPGPTRTALEDLGYFDLSYAEEQLFDTLLDPLEMNNLVADPARLDVLVEMRERLDSWQVTTGDPILRGPVQAPAGAIVQDAESRDPA